jgi:hypothetical protein
MAMGSFILGIITGIIITFAFILFYIVSLFGWDFIPLLLNILGGNPSIDDIMNLGRYFGYI